MKYSLISFWHLFDYENNFITKDILKDHTYIDFKNSDALKDIDLLIINCFINDENYNLIKSLKCKKILLITEPMGSNGWLNKLFNEKDCDIVSGCINNDVINGRYKYPLYLWPHYLNFKDSNVFKITNQFIKNCNLDEKDFCCLINRHDVGNTRTPIYNYLKDLGHITCPSHLFRNTSSEELDKLGNGEYIKKFKFCICPENQIYTAPGYITEKLLNACLGGAIPIYFGWFDDIDAKIFNKNRILMFDPRENETLENVHKKIKELLINKDKFEEFYRQDVFMDTAFETCLMMENNLRFFLT
jgi:hypothetical protein